MTELRLEVERRPGLRRCLDERPRVAGFHRVVRDQKRLVVGVLMNFPLPPIAVEDARHSAVAASNFTVQPDMRRILRAPRQHDVLDEGNVRGMGHMIDYPA